jgi:hypothetical protein
MRILGANDGTRNAQKTDGLEKKEGRRKRHNKQTKKKPVSWRCETTDRQIKSQETQRKEAQSGTVLTLPPWSKTARMPQHDCRRRLLGHSRV